MTINIPARIVSGQPTSGNCVASGRSYSRRVPQYSFIRVRLVDSTSKGQCSIKSIGRVQKLRSAHYRQKFNLTCQKANTSVQVKCFTHVSNDMTKTLVQGKLLYNTD